MGLSKPIIISASAVDTSNLATKSDMTSLQNSVTEALSGVGGAIRKAQRGTVDVGSTKAITLSGFTDVSKMLVILNGSLIWKNTDWSSATYITNTFVNGLTSTQLTISNAVLSSNSHKSSHTSTVSYQVIEFY